MFAASNRSKHLQMEIEKVIRILALFIVIAAFAVHVASRLLFDDASSVSGLPIMVALILSLGGIFSPAKTENENTNK